MAVRFGAVNALFVWYEVDSSPYDVSRLMQPFHVHRHIEALYMAPPGLPIIVEVGLVSEGDTRDVFLSE